MPDTIEIQGIAVEARIGVPEEERATAQPLRISLVLTPKNDLADLNDELSGTIDYAVVTSQVREVVDARPRQLIETLANDIAAALLAAHPLQSVSVLVEKFILPQVEAVAVRVHRSSVPPLEYSI